MCFLLASSWSIMPQVVVRMTFPNCLEGRMFQRNFSKSLSFRSYLGEMTPHLFSLPFNSTTILPDLLSSTISNSLMQPTVNLYSRKYLTILLHDSQELYDHLGCGSEENLYTGYKLTYRTCLFPAFSALMIVLRLSASTLMSTIFATLYNHD